LMPNDRTKIGKELTRRLAEDKIDKAEQHIKGKEGGNLGQGVEGGEGARGPKYHKTKEKR